MRISEFDVEAAAFLESPILLQGEHDEMMDLAIKTARYLLESTSGEEGRNVSLSMHPDYYLVERPKDRSSIVVDDVLPIIERVNRKPVLSKKACIIIDDMDLMTVPAQNKLLLSLESNKALIIGLASDLSCILDTVKSRMSLLSFSRMSFGDFEEKYKDGFKEYNKSELAYLYQLCEGDVNSAETLLENYDVFKEMRSAVRDGKYRQLLSLSHLLMEKDKDAITNNQFFAEIVVKLLQSDLIQKYIKGTICESRKARITFDKVMRQLSKSCELFKKKAFKENDFFDDFSLCMVLNKKEVYKAKH